MFILIIFSVTNLKIQNPLCVVSGCMLAHNVVAVLFLKDAVTTFVRRV